MRVGSIFFVGLCVVLAGCGARGPAPSGGEAVAEVPTLRPKSRPEALPVGASAQAAPNRVGPLGTTIAGLGDPSRPGLWLETPLVRAQGQGTVRLGDRKVNVTLLPADGPATGGSRLSLSAMQSLGAPLTELVEVQVVSGG